MLQSKTLFIVGAGASFEVGLPVGDDLKRQIAALIDIRFDDGWNRSNGDPQITEVLRQIAREDQSLNGNINPFLHEAWQIKDALPTAISIDNLLDAHRGNERIETCGKLGIARAILEAERGSKLKGLGDPGVEYSFSALAATWYIPLFQMMTENVHKADVAKVADRLSFIIFNYDRCLEYFIPHALSTYYGIELAEAEAIAARMTFIHPYGQVGYLPWQGRNPAAQFGAERYPLRDIAAEIKTFAEGLTTPELVNEISSAVQDAETIVFMGFAYHPINMRVISTEAELTRKVFGTTYGLSKADEAVVKDDILRVFNKRDPQFLALPMDEPSFAEELDTLDLQSLTCADFLRQYFRSIGARPADE
jgi:hypothetical protein